MGVLHEAKLLLGPVSRVLFAIIVVQIISFKKQTAKSIFQDMSTKINENTDRK